MRPGTLAYLASRASNGLNPGRGTRMHVLDAPCEVGWLGKSICGAQPGPRSAGWYPAPADAEITCPSCRRLFNQRGS